MEGYAYGFISQDTLRLLGITSSHTELKISVAENAMNKQHIKNNTYMLKEYLEHEGIQVTKIEIPNPGKHPHYDQMATLLYLMEVFGLLALILSGILVANVISAILKQQTRQIGIMKAIGGSSMQIATLYLGMVVILSLSAMALSIPAGIFAGRGYAFIAAELLNFNIYSYDIPLYVFALETAIGLFVPIFIAAYPIIRGSQITVREAINDYGISQDKYLGKQKNISSKLLRILPRPFILSLRNTFRRRGRFIFTMLVMAAGGTGFIVAMNMYASMYSTVDAKIDSISYDIQVTFDNPHPVEAIENSIRQIPGVTEVEAWSGTNASRVY